VLTVSFCNHLLSFKPPVTSKWMSAARKGAYTSMALPLPTGPQWVVFPYLNQHVITSAEIMSS